MHNIFFLLISKRYEKHNTIITTNMPFSNWADVFGSATIVKAILDRLLHHSHVISIKGPSYRLKSKVEYFNSSTNVS
jgi:DNA replication protein DnaC